MLGLQSARCQIYEKHDIAYSISENLERNSKFGKKSYENMFSLVGKYADNKYSGNFAMVSCLFLSKLYVFLEFSTNFSSFLLDWAPEQGDICPLL